MTVASVSNNPSPMYTTQLAPARGSDSNISLEDSRKRLRTGKTTLAVSATDPANDRSIDYLLDPRRPGAVQVRSLVDDQLQKSLGRADAFTATQTEFDEPGSTFVDFLVPGLLGIGLMGGGM